MNKLMALRKQGEEPAPEAPSEEILLLTQIRDLLGGADTTVVGPPTGGLPTAGGVGPTTPSPPRRDALTPGSVRTRTSGRGSSPRVGRHL